MSHFSERGFDRIPAIHAEPIGGVSMSETKYGPVSESVSVMGVIRVVARGQTGTV